MSSMRLSDIAAQLKAINGAACLGDDSCNIRASTSLPAPVGPASKTVTSVSATRCVSASNFLLVGSTNT